MNTISIGIVEDEMIIAYDMQSKLQSLGYTVAEPCGSYAAAIQMLTSAPPDLVILDINLDGRNEGIEIGKFIRKNMYIPFIYLTANSDTATVAAAKETTPNAFLVKPFNKDSLYSAIEIALHNYNSNRHVKNERSAEKSGEARDFLFVKIGDYFNRINFADILYMESEHNYVNVYTGQKKFPVRTTMQEFLESFDTGRFVRIHRSYVVNIDKIEKINAVNVIINGKEIPVSSNYREELLALLNVH